MYLYSGIRINGSLFKWKISSCLSGSQKWSNSLSQTLFSDKWITKCRVIEHFLYLLFLSQDEEDHSEKGEKINSTSSDSSESDSSQEEEEEEDDGSFSNNDHSHSSR